MRDRGPMAGQGAAPTAAAGKLAAVALGCLVALPAAGQQARQAPPPLSSTMPPAMPTTLTATAPSAPSAPGPRLSHLPGQPEPWRLDAVDGLLRSGFGGMIDLVPFDQRRLHLSAGARLIARTGADIERERLMAGPRGTGSRLGKRFAPALLMGVGDRVERGVAFGADAGVLIGQSSGTPYRVGQRMRGDETRGTPLNRLARVTMSYRF